MTRILVTGSAGFIARSLIRKLLAEGNFVFGLDLMETPKKLFKSVSTQYFQPLVADISDPKICDPTYGANWWDETDVCFHLAAMANVDEVAVQREKAFQVNLHGTFNIVEACRKRGIPLIFASTCCVYGNTPQHPSMEDGPTCPMDWYGVTKRTGEELIRGLLGKAVMLRFGTTYGPEMRDALCTSIILRQAMQGAYYTVKGDGRQTRNWVYIDDLIDGCVRAMRFALRESSMHMNFQETFNLCGEQPYTVLDLVRICHHLACRDEDWKKCIKFLPARADDVMMENISVEKARRVLDWEPKIEFPQGMAKIHEEWKKCV